MAIQDSDLLLVNRGNQSYQVRADELALRTIDSDLFLVNHSTSNITDYLVGPITGVDSTSATYSTSLTGSTSLGGTETLPFNGTLGTNGAKDTNLALTNGGGSSEFVRFTYTTSVAEDGEIILGSNGRPIRLEYNIGGSSYTSPSNFIPEDNANQTVTWSGGLVVDVSYVFDENNGGVQPGKQAEFDKYIAPFLVSGWSALSLKYLVRFRGPLTHTRSFTYGAASTKARYWGLWVNDRWLTDGETETTLTFDNTVANDLLPFEAGDQVVEVGNGNDGQGTVLSKTYIGDSEGSTENTLVLLEEQSTWDVGSSAKTSKPGDGPTFYQSFKATKTEVFDGFTILDTDHFLVNRNGTSFYATGLEIKNYFGI